MMGFPGETSASEKPARYDCPVCDAEGIVGFEDLFAGRIQLLCEACLNMWTVKTTPVKRPAERPMR